MQSLLSLTKAGQYLYTLTYSEHNELISMYVSDPTATIPKTVPTQSVLTQRLKGHKQNICWSCERPFIPKRDMRPTGTAVRGYLGY